MGKQGIFLKYCIQMSLVGRYIGNLLSLKEHLPGIRLFKSAYNTQGSGFSAAGRSQQCNEFILINCQVKIV